ncbi:MAG: tyrosine-type recombinase/integrase [Bacteroidales bacterium]|nr:tyrosine-type recombinase/integrase [Bacteroidales bacterium]
MLKERFIDYLRFEKRFSPHTIKSYEHDLMQFSAYLQAQYTEEHPENAIPEMIRSWMVSLLEANITSRSVNRKLSTLNSFYHFCLRSGEIELNPLKKVNAPKSSSGLPVFLDKDKMEDLFQEIHFEDTFEGCRDRTMIMLLYSTGIRRSELLGLKSQDLDLVKGTLKVLGKRNKERIIPIGSYICTQLEIYIRSKEKNMLEQALITDDLLQTNRRKVKSANYSKQRNNTDILFVTSAGRPIGARQVYDIIHKLLSQVSSQSKLSPHVLRHTFATHMLNDGADLNSIKELLGHTSLAATQVYTHNTIEKLKLIFKQAHPRA